MVVSAMTSLQLLKWHFPKLHSGELQIRQLSTGTGTATDNSSPENESDIFYNTFAKGENASF
jgi:hypothetical protein